MYILIPGYTLGLILTLLSTEEFVNVGWDSAGVTTGPVTEVTLDVVDIDLPPEDLILPSTEPTSTDSGSESISTTSSSDSAVDTTKESGSDVGATSPTESEVLKTAIDKLPPTDI